MSRLDPRLLLQGYAAGIFPMADSREASELFWVEPRSRAIIPLDRFHMSKSLRKTIRSGRFAVTMDRDFNAVIGACADREETWINADIERAMRTLHGSGHAHSIEVWAGNELVGGLYGVKLGRAFFGESMFSRTPDASKVALAWLVARMKVGGYGLLDCQFMTAHLASLGAVSISRKAYVALLSGALGGGEGGVGAGSVAGVPVVAGPEGSASGAAVEVPRSPVPDLFALDRLLEATGAAGSAAASGYVIAQLLGQTS
jgi:leucyl/phenylalanyl-tRNA---protein transferase